MRRPRLNPNSTPVIWWIGTSTKHQKYSPLIQLDWCWQMSLENGFYPMAILRVPGHSRAYIFYQDAARDIPAYQKLLDIFSGNHKPKPQFLLTQARDRLGRNALATQVEALCDDQGCKIWSGRTGRPMQESIGQIFAAGMELTMSRAELHQTQARRRGAMLRRVKEKKLPYGKPEYGYRTVRDESGKSIGVELHPLQAPVRQLIDEWFMAGNSPLAIARRLNARYAEEPDKYAPSQGNTWHGNVIRKLLRSRYPSGEYRAKVSGEAIVVMGNHPCLRTPEQQQAIERQFARRSRGTQRGNSGPARYYGIAFCADCGARMTRVHRTPLARNNDLDYTCGRYRQSVKIGRKTCSTHYTYEGSINQAVIAFFQQPIDEVIAMVAGQAPKDCSQEIELAQSRLDRVRQQKKEAVTLRVRYALADREFADLIEELSQAEADVSREIAELKATQLKIPDTAQIRNWLAEMLTIDKLQAWLKNDDPANVRSVLAGRIRVKCYQRPYKSSEPAPTVELCL